MSGSPTNLSWAELFDTFKGTPARTLADDGLVLKNILSSYWPTVQHDMSINHLKRTAQDILARNGLKATPLWYASEGAFLGVTALGLFAIDAQQCPELDKWLTTATAPHQSRLVRLRQQMTTPRPPLKLTTGALEELLAEIKRWIRPRKGLFLNKTRTDRLLALMRERVQGNLDFNTITMLVEEQIQKKHGTPNARVLTRKGQHGPHFLGNPYLPVPAAVPPTPPPAARPASP